MATATTEGWVVKVGGRKRGSVHPTRQAAREWARGQKLQGFKVEKGSATAGAGTKPRKSAKSSKARKSTGGGYVPAVRRKCGDCGHYRKRDELKDAPREVTFERGGKTITQTRNVMVCAKGCRDNVR